jgi:hypothetical protein
MQRDGGAREFVGQARDAELECGAEGVARRSGPHAGVFCGILHARLHLLEATAMEGRISNTAPRQTAIKQTLGVSFNLSIDCCKSVT